MQHWIKEAAKFWVAIGGTIVIGAVAEFGLPDWVTWAVGAVTAVAVYLVPNADPNEDDWEYPH